jgi:hypothetical protein
MLCGNRLRVSTKHPSLTASLSSVCRRFKACGADVPVYCQAVTGQLQVGLAMPNIRRKHKTLLEMTLTLNKLPLQKLQDFVDQRWRTCACFLRIRELAEVGTLMQRCESLGCFQKHTSKHSLTSVRSDRTLTHILQELRGLWVRNGEPAPASGPVTATAETLQTPRLPF